MTSSTGDVTADGQKVESYPTEYEIIGVVPDNKTPIVYVPLMQLKKLGITSYSQVKLVTNNQSDVSKVRKQVEVLGYRTTSVVDTVSQIEKLFGTVRLLLGLLGVVALAVASLGMFNTLTVSLLERTHEVGMMKTIGMKSTEIQDLFLTESMIMGLFGGIGGLLLGFLAGKFLSAILSIIAIYKHIGILDISFIPFSFILIIMVLSVIVGITTGLYPSYRAKKISALNALRYE